MAEKTLKRVMDNATAADRARAEVAARVAQNGEGINPAYVSLVTDQDPDDYVAGTGVAYGVKPISGNLIQRLFWDVEDSESGWQDLGSPVPSKEYVDDKASLLQEQITDLDSSQQSGMIGYETKAIMDADTGQSTGTVGRVMNDSTPSNNGVYRYDGSDWIKQAALTDVETVKSWVTAEAFDISAITYSDEGNIATATLVWPDSEAGSISDLVEDSEGRIESIRFNRPDSKYITFAITYDGDDVATTTLTATGY